MELSLIDIYRIGMNAVKLFPAQNPPAECMQLQTFRVLQREHDTELDSETLGAVPTDKDSPFFWSRLWHEKSYLPNALSFDWPVLTMFEIVNKFKHPGFMKGNQRCYQIEMTVWDKYRQDCVGGQSRFDPCHERPVNQIYIDTGILLDSVLQYFAGTVTAVTNVDPVEKVYFLPYLQHLKDTAAISSFEVKTDFQNTLGINKDMRFSRVERTTSQTFGTKTQFLFCTSNCPQIEYNTEITDFGLLAFEAGCKNC